MQLKIALMDLTEYLGGKNLLPEQVYNANGLVFCSYTKLKHSPRQQFSNTTKWKLYPYFRDITM